LAKERLAGAFYADLNSRTRFDNQHPSFLLSERLKDSVYRELADSSAVTKKQPAIALTISPNAHSLAVQSLTSEYQQEFAFEPEDSELLISKHLRKQDKLAQTAVDEFRAELVGAIE
jgi:hypothetical protein